MDTIRFTSRTSTIILAGLAMGCATTGGVRNAPMDAGVSKTFSAPYDRVLDAARDATVAAGLAIDTFQQVDSNTAVIVGKSGMSMWSYGELVRVVVERRDADNVLVHVYTKRKLATNVLAKSDYSETIFETMAQSSQLRSGAAVAGH